MMRSPIEKCYWQDVRQHVHSINAPLATLIDEIDPGQGFPLYRLRYEFGEQIVSSGQFLIPGGGGEAKKFKNRIK